MECEVSSLECEKCSVECEDFASSLAEKIKRLSREGHGRDRLSLNYRSFMFGKLPPPACPGLCYIYICILYIYSYHLPSTLRPGPSMSPSDSIALGVSLPSRQLGRIGAPSAAWPDDVVIS